MIASSTPIRYLSDIIVKTIEERWIPFQPGPGFTVSSSNPVSQRSVGATIQKQPKK